MSLFGNLGGGTSKPGGNLFGNLSTPATTAQSTGGLFGAANTGTQQQNSGFGGLGGGQQQQQSGFGGSFGNLGNATSSAPQQPSTGTSTLFSNLGGAAQQNTGASSGSSLFSNLGTSQPQQHSGTTGGGAFSNLGTSQTPAQEQKPALGGSLFGGLGTSQPQQQQTAQGSNLFPSLGQPKPAASGGLFSGLGASTVQTPASTGALFGGLGTNNAPATSAPAASNSLFGSMGGIGRPMEQQQQQQQVPQQAQDGTQAQNVPGTSSYFDHLLERSKKRQNQENAGSFLGDLPTLQLGLGDIARKVRNLGTGGPSASQARAGDVKTHYLLAASGVQTGAALRDLNNLNAQTNVPVPTGISGLDTDIDGYLSNLQTQSTLDLIAEGLEQSKRDFDAFLEENVQMEWDAQRRRIYEHFGLAKSEDYSGAGISGIGEDDRGAFGKSSRRGRPLGSSGMSGSTFGASLGRSVLGGPVGRASTRGNKSFTDVSTKSSEGQSFGEDPHQRNKQEKYAEKVKELNLHRLQDLVFPLLTQFAEAESQPGLDNVAKLDDAYRALIEITGENPDIQRPSDPGAIRERQYFDEYLDESPNSARSISIRKRILNGSRRFLEKQFFNRVRETILKSREEAKLGGVPTDTHRIKAYVRLRAARKELGSDVEKLQKIEDDYCWVLVFYLLRCGLVLEAVQYVKDNERAFKSLSRNFYNYLLAFYKSTDGRIESATQRKIENEYQSQAKNAEQNIDPYRQACYKIIGRCDLGKRSLEGINQGLDDWLWLQFALAREVSRVEEAAGDFFGLEDLRSDIKEIGARHFAPGNDQEAGGYSVYFYLQILCGMFEQAVAYLYPHNYVAAVHFAIGLTFYGLLRVSNWTVSESELLTFTTKQQPQLNFGRMLGVYTRDFRTAKAEAATDYLTLICLNADLRGEAGRLQVDLCHAALRELVLETREFALLLGDLGINGQRIKGAIEQRLKLLGLSDQDDFLKSITINAASVADDSGRITDAVLLYHLAGEYDNVVSIINRSLSDALSLDLGEDHIRLEPLKPRTTASAQQTKQADYSLSLTAVDDPVILAKNMISFYDRDAGYFSRISTANRAACGVLLDMSRARALVAQHKWIEAVDLITKLELLPLTARGSIPQIRAHAQNFNALQPVVARNVGNLLMWAIACCGRRREELLGEGGWEDVPSRRALADELLGKARDLMVFVGLVRYKLPPRVFEALARAGQDLGGL
ncbi:NIC-domain-containing protein [Patellaria atrata CBS 101060]|uniref:NIC-domain-containing protein n=1 Tax=Patellaria atrata CBS 101060 TaxID=1346257 RepID=A0A9P4SK16_9PEZI|nr:NIC-domain-containing protein [Patellaria atrata CBS 101060]